jgi:hypothetical protein
MWSVRSHGSSSLLFIMKVMVLYFVSDTHKVVTALISCLFCKTKTQESYLQSVVVEFSLQSHR